MKKKSVAKKSQPLVSIIMGSDSDLPTMSEASKALEAFGVPFEMKVISAHRTPDEMALYAMAARSRGILVIIAGAGGAAHLPGMTAAYTELPVIGVPVVSGTLQGQDALLSIVQMPKGVPVATVAIGGAFNAAVLATQIVGTGHPEYLNRVRDYKQNLRKMVLEKKI